MKLIESKWGRALGDISIDSQFDLADWAQLTSEGFGIGSSVASGSTLYVGELTRHDPRLTSGRGPVAVAPDSWSHVRAGKTADVAEPNAGVATTG